MNQLMKAKFQLSYVGKSLAKINAEVENDIKSDDHKLDFIDAVASMLGVRDRLIIQKPLPDEMWEHEGNEAHE